MRALSVALHRGLIIAAIGVLAACASLPATSPSTVPAAEPPPPASVPESSGPAIVATARRLLGTAYRFGGADPSGFDCSGLVQYVYAQASIVVPRTVVAQRAIARPVSPGELAPGDLLFFAFAGGTPDHVGIFVGDGLFVHAPRSGKPVSLQALSDHGYRQHLSGAGRLR